MHLAEIKDKTQKEARTKKTQNSNQTKKIGQVRTKTTASTTEMLHDFEIYMDRISCRVHIAVRLYKNMLILYYTY